MGGGEGMRRHLTHDERLRLLARLDQADAACESHVASDSEFVDDVMRRFRQVSNAVVPLLYSRIGAERVAEYFSRGADGLMGEWVDTMAFHAPGDVEAHYQLFARHVAGV